MAKGIRVGFRGVCCLALGSALLAGYTGGITSCPGFENTQRRFRSVANRTDQVTISGYVDQSSGTICAYQQTKDGSLSAPLACASPVSNQGNDGCGVYWYDFALNFSLLGDDNNWFGQHNPTQGAYEYTRVIVKSGADTFFSFTGDEAFGPSDSSSCYRSRARENGAMAPITFYRGGVPAERDCASGENSHDGCPFTCNLPYGCDVSYGISHNPFSEAAYRANYEGQTTALTRFDHYGANSSYSPPTGNWSYQWESGASPQYIVMRRNNYTSDSLNIRRGERRRNSYVSAWVKAQYVDGNNTQLGVISRFHDNNNYFTFMVLETGGDLARIQRFAAGYWLSLATSYPSFNLLSWTKLGFTMRDRGTYGPTGFTPDGNCSAVGAINDAVVVSLSSTPCSFAPHGGYGVFSYYHSSAQFWNLDAYAMEPLP